MLNPKKVRMNLFRNKNRRADLGNKLMVTGRENRGEGSISSSGLTYTLVYIKQIINLNQPYSTGNSTQYFVITYKGKESEKEYIYI